MSKRFGRQQKRKMRQQIEHLTCKLEDAEKRFTQLRIKASRNNKIVEDTARLLGEHFITLDPKQFELTSLSALQDEWNYIKKQDLPFEIITEASAKFLSKIKSSIGSVPVLKCQSVILDPIRDAVHYRFSFNGKTAGYAISQTEIMQTPAFKNHVAKNMAEELARIIVDETPIEFEIPVTKSTFKKPASRQ